MTYMQYSLHIQAKNKSKISLHKGLQLEHMQETEIEVCLNTNLQWGGNMVFPCLISKNSTLFLIGLPLITH